jgi:hypothetical protein
VAAKQLVEVVDPQDNGAADGRSLLDRLRGAPEKVLSSSPRPPPHMLAMP